MQEFNRASKDVTILYFYLFHEIVFANRNNIENIVIKYMSGQSLRDFFNRHHQNRM